MYSVNFNFLATKSDNSKSIKDDLSHAFSKIIFIFALKIRKLGRNPFFVRNNIA